MKIKSMVKYNINSLRNSMCIFYLIIITLCILLGVLSRTGNVSSSGMEFSTVIFIFIVGLNIFKENFYFAKGNNISRKTYFSGTILSMIPVAMIMSIIDIVLNRIYNLFVNSPTMYDMGFTNYVSPQYMAITNYVPSTRWIQSNSIETLVNTFLFQGTLYLFAISLGFIISLIYYKCNKIMKVVISISPVMLIMLLEANSRNFPNLAEKVARFMQYILGVIPVNPYAPMITFVILFVILAIIGYLLVRKAIIKEK